MKIKLTTYEPTGQKVVTHYDLSKPLHCAIVSALKRAAVGQGGNVIEELV